jgi:hypothetical protein
MSLIGNHHHRNVITSHGKRGAGSFRHPFFVLKKSSALLDVEFPVALVVELDRLELISLFFSIPRDGILS